MLPSIAGFWFAMKLRRFRRVGEGGWVSGVVPGEVQGVRGCMHAATGCAARAPAPHRKKQDWGEFTQLV